MQSLPPSILDLGNSLQIGNLGAKWSAYPSEQAIILGVVLLVLGLVFVYSGVRIRGRVYRANQRIGGLAGLMVFATWILSVVVVIFFLDLLSSSSGGILVPSPISPVTYATAGVTFFAISVCASLRNRGRLKVALLSAFVGTVVGAMIFELPFLFIISPQIGLPPQEALLGMSPLFCLVFSSYSLLFLSPLTSFSRYTSFSLAAVFIVFSSWAFLTHFAFPSDPVSFALNSASKVLSFVSATTLFLHKGVTTKMKSEEPAMAKVRNPIEGIR